MKVWKNAEHLKLLVSGQITGGFDVGFDRAVPEATRDLLMRFAYWVEDHYPMPVTLWVDFKYNHYLISRKGKRVGYKFYWVDFKNYPVFENFDDIPVIELPVRTEHYTIEEILSSFIDAISMYYVWLSNSLTDDYATDINATEEVLQAYLEYQKGE